MYQLKFITAFLFGLIALSATAEIRVSASFNPSSLALGNKSQYIVEIRESSADKRPVIEPVNRLPISQLDDLAMSNGRISTKQQTNIINGAAEYSVTQQLTIDAKPAKIGSYTIPSYEFEYKGETLRVPASTLDVIERASDAGPTTDELIFLKSDTPPQLYVGQTTQIQLKLYISEKIRLTGLINFDRSADGFTISELPENKETTEIFKGRRYLVLTWPLTITPIQTGTQDINFQLTVSANIPEQNNRRDPFGGHGMGGSIFDSFFGRSERFTVYTEPTQIDVLPLPSTDQPDSFTGAIGNFTIKAYTDRESTQTGEPIMLSVEVSGTGNFDRISGPEIPDTNGWRSYDPEINFKPHSSNSTVRGTKRFDYVMINDKAGTIDIPEINFAYFDPEAKRYSKLSWPPIPIEVLPSDKPAATTAPSIQIPMQANNVIPLKKELSMEDALLTLDYRNRPGNRLNWATWKDAPFWIINAAIAIMIVTSSILLRHRRRLEEDSAYADQHAAKRELRSATKASLQANKADGFYAHAQNAIRLALTCRTQNNLRNANISELSRAMESVGIAEETIAQTRDFFAKADVQRFAGGTTKADISEAKSELERILKAI